MRELFPLSKTKITKKEAIEKRVERLLVDDQRLKEDYREKLEKRGKRKVKKELSLDEISEKIKKRILDTNFLEGISSEGIGTVSASKLRTYRGCHFAYLLNYILHLPPPIYLPRMAAGEDIHKILEGFNKGVLQTKDELINGRTIECIENGKKKEKKILGWKARWYGSVFSRNIYFNSEAQQHIIFRSGTQALEKFFEREKDKPKPQFAEEPFKDVSLSYEIGGEKVVYKLRGFFDKIDIRDSRIKITDYKTGDASKVFADFDLKPEDLEMALYHLALYKTQEIEEKKTSRSKTDLKYLGNEIYNADTDIRKKNFTPFIGMHCQKNSCLFLDLCHPLLCGNDKSLFDFLVSQYKGAYPPEICFQAEHFSI
ncbi:PD-(D/E)XK nuclease family protein [Candidatus Pacearchaeota archaeon]|nr:PD-(D/E)XK nuclease family protein [Candidatus Pacearchaeota archaeon]